MNTRSSSATAAARGNAASTLLVTPDTPKLDALLAYAAIGWKSFLLSPSKMPVRNCDRCRRGDETNPQKEACPCLMCHGFYAATDDPDRLREMVRRTPNGLVAIRAGAASGIVMMDIDTPDAHGVDGLATAANLKRWGYLPHTLTAESGTGGPHLLYAHPGDGWIKGAAHALGPGVDVRGDGGYFVAAPSRHPNTGRPYRWAGDTVSLPLTPLHPRVANHLRRRDAPEPVRRPVTVPDFRDQYVTAAVAGEVQAILDAPKGGKGLRGRNDALNRSSFILGTLVGAGVLDQGDAENALTAAAYAVGLDHDTNCNAAQIARTIRSGITAGMRNPRRLQGAR